MHKASLTRKTEMYSSELTVQVKKWSKRRTNREDDWDAAGDCQKVFRSRDGFGMNLGEWVTVGKEESQERTGEALGVL